MNNPYSPPKAPVSDPRLADEDDVEYAGFWIRVVASIIDSILIVVITAPLLIWIYGFNSYVDEASSFMRGPAEFLISYVLPAIAVVLFWVARQATPGKMALSLRIVDAETFDALRPGQAIGRYLGYYLSTLVFGLGFLWVAFDSRKQGWHDKLAGTVVIQGRK